VPVSVLQVLGVKVCTDGSVESNDLFINYQLQEIFNNKIIAIKKKPIKKGNNEIITQYLRVSLRSNTSRPVWAYPWMSDDSDVYFVSVFNFWA
jgi:hypothetical protein